MYFVVAHKFFLFLHVSSVVEVCFDTLVGATRLPCIKETVVEISN